MSRRPAGRDSEPVYRQGEGFGDSIRARMSEPLQRQLALSDAREEREAAKEAARQAEIAAAYQERAIAAAIQEAHARGEMVSVHEAYRTGGASLGHTPSEFIANYNARMDLEDMQHAADEAAAFRRWQLERSADMSHDSSEWEAERAERKAHHEEWGPKVAERRAREAETRKLIRSDRRLREMGFRGV